MRIAVFSFHKFEEAYFVQANNQKHDAKFFTVPLNIDTVELANGFDAVSIFVNDDASKIILQKLESLGIKYLLLRSAGYNHVDITQAKVSNIKVVRVPEYSPYAVAEHTVALMLALNRKLNKAHNRIRELNFSLDGLVGFDMHGKTVGIIGSGKIGSVVARILNGFGCDLLIHDQTINQELVQEYNAKYVDCLELCKSSDIITLHVPLNQKTKYIINKDCISHMKDGVMLINTSRGGLINTKDVIIALKQGKIGYLGIDVYEEEGGLFFEDHSEDILQDDVIARLMTFNNVLITSHQAFLTSKALKNIADTTINNADQLEKNIDCSNEVTV